MCFVMEPIAPKEPRAKKVPGQFRRRSSDSFVEKCHHLVNSKLAAAVDSPSTGPATIQSPLMSPRTSRTASLLSPSIARRFDFIRKLGEGSFGVVHLVRDRMSGMDRICKVIDTFGMKKTVLEQMKKEIQILSSLEHPHVVRIFHYVEDKFRSQLILILEYLPGGGCNRLLQKVGCLDEALAARLVRQLITAVSYCHSKGIAHRDIKPEHMMLVQSNINGSFDMKIIDFGLAVDNDSICGMQLDRTGTPAYMAPEVVNRQVVHASKSDMWSIGVCALELLSGQNIFLGGTRSETFKKIRRHGGLADIDAVLGRNEEWRCLGKDARDFLRCLLEADPANRLCASEALAHSWLSRIDAVPAGDSDSPPKDRRHIIEVPPKVRLLDCGEHSPRMATFARPRSRSSPCEASMFRLSVNGARAVCA